MSARRGRKKRYKTSATTCFVLLGLAALMAGGAYIYGYFRSSSKPYQILQVASATSQINDADADNLIYTIIPAGTPSQIKNYSGFIVDFNSDNHTANYVGWNLTSEMVNGTVSRSDNFWHDDSVEGCPELSDYRRSGYDRGHLYPAADAKWSQESMDDCFSLANMTPQLHSLNNGAWKTLEEKERLWVQRDGRLVIIAGPIYSSTDNLRIGKTGVRVPSGFFKVILAPDVASPRAIAFVYPNDYAPGNMQNYSMSVDEAEQLTGFDFFSSLPDDIETILEQNTSFKEWNRR